eukprot:9879890-Prorocentrum_lima.AAC.1
MRDIMPTTKALSHEYGTRAPETGEQGASNELVGRLYPQAGPWNEARCSRRAQDNPHCGQGYHGS